MIRLNVRDLLDNKGKTPYWLYRQLGMSYQNITRMINNETQSIRYSTIENLCDVLECTPGELFVYTQEKK